MVQVLSMFCPILIILYFETFFGQFKVLSRPLLARGFREN